VSKRLASLIIICILILSPSFVLAEVGNINKEVIVLFRDSVNTSLIEENNGVILEEFDFTPAVKVNIPAISIDRLKMDPSIVAIEQDQPIRVEGQIKGWGYDTVRATNPNANSSYTGKGVKIAVLDSGISPHEDLTIAGGVSFQSYTTSYSDDFGHGTHVAGIIAAKNNEIGTVGIAPDADIYSVKVINQYGEGLVSNLVAGIEWCINNDIDIINLSLGSGRHSILLEQTIYKANHLGLSVVAAGGNNGNIDGSGDTVEYPARYDSAIAVAAVDQSNNRASFSATGNAIEVSAPGVEILSTYLNNEYATFGGTSMATGFVTGNLALLKEMYPTQSNFFLRNKLREMAVDLGVTGRDSYFGYGLIQAPSYPDRIAGKDRFEVAINVSRKGWDSSNTVFVSNYIAFADALSAGPLAYKYNAPILLTAPSHLTVATKQEITRLGAKEVIIIGGKASVSDGVINELSQMGLNIRRIDGKNRFEVSANIARELGSYSSVVVTNGLNYPDALAIAPYASKVGVPILLTKPNELPFETKELLSAHPVTSSIVVGGEGSVSPSVYFSLPNPTRIGGKDRYEVAANIFNTYFQGTNRTYISSGTSFADALTGSVLITKQGTGLLLTKKETLPDVTQSVLNKYGIKDITILGGVGSVGDTVFQ
jgi:minor extracellular protease Epr